MNAATLVLTFFGLLACGAPVFAALLGSSFIYILFLSPLPLTYVASTVATGLMHYSLLAIPLFILAAQLMNTSKVTDRIFEFCQDLVGHLRGSLGHANILASIVFAGMSGSATADAAGLGRVEIEGMTRAGFDKKFAAAVTAASSCIGPIIPPSIIMIVYASQAEQSTGRLFLGGILPGFIMAITMMVLVYFIALQRNYVRFERASAGKLARSFRRAFLPLLTPAIILGGIGSGITTPTEAAVVAVAYSLFLGMVVYREIKPRDLPGILGSVALSTAIILIIFAAATVFTRLLTVERVPFAVAQFLLTALEEPWLILIALNIMLLIGGMIMEPTPLLLIVTPVILPVAAALDVDLVHLGVFVVLNLMIGNITPPFALGLFVVADVSRLPFWTLVREVAPFYVPLIATLLLIVFIPQIVLFIPDLLLPTDR